MSFGLHGVAMMFQHLMDKVLAQHGGYAAAYINNMVVYSGTWEEHLLYSMAMLEEL